MEEKQQQIDIKKLNVTELQALAYQFKCNEELALRNLRMIEMEINNRIQEENKPVSEKKDASAKPDVK